VRGKEKGGLKNGWPFEFVVGFKSLTCKIKRGEKPNSNAEINRTRMWGPSNTRKKKESQTTGKGENKLAKSSFRGQGVR